MQFFLNLTNLAYVLDGFSVLTSGHNTSTTARQTSPLPTSASTYEPTSMPSTSAQVKPMTIGPPGLDLKIDCTETQKRAIKGAREFGRDLLKAVQGFPRPASLRESLGQLSEKDLRTLEKWYFGKGLRDKQRNSVRG